MDTVAKILIVLTIYAILSGIILLETYPDESYFYFNPPAVWLGDYIYEKTIETVGNPYSPYAHYTIPWITRIPQIYLVSSILIYVIPSVIIYFLIRKKKI